MGKYTVAMKHFNIGPEYGFTAISMTTKTEHGAGGSGTFLT